MHQEPGHTWVGSALTGQRLQEPALLGVPMYEAHRSWQLPGQCRAAIIMYAARNRIRLSPILLAAWAGPSLRRAVTAHLMAFEPRAAGKGLRQARAYLLPTTLTRPMALSATCAGVAWLPCHSCTGSLRAKPILQYLGGWLGVGADFARSGGQWRARKPQRSAAAGEHRTGEHPAQRTIDAHAAQQPFGRVQGCSTPCTLALRRERSSKRQRLLVKAAGREDRARYAGIVIRADL